jgi:hypothetical protein
MEGPDRALATCGIARIVSGFGVCVGCEDGELVRSRLVATLERARVIAELWRLEVVEKGLIRLTP